MRARLRARAASGRHLIRTDLSGVDGCALARQLQAQQPDAPATYMAPSGSEQSHDKISARGAGFDHQIEWPVTMAALRRILPPAPPGVAIFNEINGLGNEKASCNR